MENILLRILFSMVVVLSLNTALSEAAATKTLTLDRRTNDGLNLALLSQDTNGDVFIRRSREIGSILLAVKNQIKSIFLDIIREAYNFVKSFTSRLINKLLSKFQLVTISDVLRPITNSFTESTSDLGDDWFADTAPQPVEIDSWEVEDSRNPY